MTDSWRAGTLLHSQTGHGRLAELYAAHAGKLSDKWSLYLTEYDRIFADFRLRPVRLLEIGVQNGGSLEIWSRYFANAEVLLGCDIDPNCARLAYDDPRIAVVIGNAADPDTAIQVFEHCRRFDIVIDDGSHRSSDIIRSFLLYFPRLADGGVFVAEDLHCSYWKSFEGGLFDPYSTVSFFKRLVDILNHEHWGVARTRADVLAGFFRQYGCALEAEDFLSAIHSVEFVNSLCVVRKAAPEQNRLGRQIVGGTLEAVTSSRKELDQKAYQPDSTLDQSGNPWTSRTLPPDEALPEVEERLAAARRQSAALNRHCAGLAREIAAARRELQAMHRSTSWRLTAPLRLAVRRARAWLADLKRIAAMPKTSAALPSRNGARSATAVPARLREMLVRRGHLFYRHHLKGTRLGRSIGYHILRLGLVQAAELQAPAFRHGSPAAPDIADARQACSELNRSLPGFDISPPLELEVSDALLTRPSINVLLPSLRLEHMSGGPNSALQLAALLAEHGERVRLFSCNLPIGDKDALLRHMDALCGHPVRRECIEIADSARPGHPVVIGANDIFLATAWWTAQIAKEAMAKTCHGTFIYLIQDFEPILHEGSTAQARALETYDFEHIPVINTRLLLEHLVREKVGRYARPEFAAGALHFEPAVDRRRYFPEPRRQTQADRRLLLFYARPTLAHRNLFEMGVAALRQAVAAGAIDQEHWQVCAMGEKLSPLPLGNGVFLEPLPWMRYDEYAERVRTADLLLSLMLSPHPSYPPLEMAACGNLVVTNAYSVKTAGRLQALSPNILVAEPTVDSVAAALRNAAGRINAGLPSHDPDGAMALPADWSSSLGEVVPALLERIQGLRIGGGESGRKLAGGLPSTARTDYERCRKASLARRRRADRHDQEAGLLSFVTPVYDTDPVFLRELGASLFRQDGGMQFEWLILDNGSGSADTRQALRELARHPGVRLERVDDNLGIVGGMRYLLEHARGRYILPLDSDDLVEPDCVHVLTRHIQANAYPPLLYTDEDKLGQGGFGSPYFKPAWDPVLFLHSCYIAHLCAIDRELALALGLYTDAGAEGCHDWDSFIRFMLAGHPPLHIPEVLYTWRMHDTSTSGNIASKPYISESHRHTLQGFLARSGVRDIELVESPLFGQQVDWWFRRERINPKTMRSIAIGRPHGWMEELAAALAAGDCELIRLHWDGIVPDDDEWPWEAMGLLELFADAVMVGGLVHDGSRVLGGPMVFGFGNGFDCPDAGRTLADSGNGAGLWKQHSVSALSTAHCVVKAGFLKECLAALGEAAVPAAMLGPWLGALAYEAGQRIVYSPFMNARASGLPEDAAEPAARAHFLSRFWARIPDHRFYSPRFGLARQAAYAVVAPEDNLAHLARLQAMLMPYPDWLAMHLQRRARLYPLPGAPARISLLTTVYEGTDMDYLAALAASVSGQTLPPAQWIIVAHGPVDSGRLAEIGGSGALPRPATLIVEPEPLGIMAAMRRALASADGDYVAPVDADDLLTPDALQILASAIARCDAPDLVYSDEDALIDGQPAMPYLRPPFDPILNLDSSYIWHLCAIRRERAVALGLYADPGATWCHDWDSVMRIADAGGRIEHIPEVLYHWRQHAASTTNNTQGDPRSLQSIRHVLEERMARRPDPGLYRIADYPIFRGTRELYVARAERDLPRFVWMADIGAGLETLHDGDLLVVTDGSVRIDAASYAEAARLFELHPALAALGGRVVDADGIVCDACRFADLESPWLGRPPDYPGPYALALKTQTVAATGARLAFFRLGPLKALALPGPLPSAWAAPDVLRLCADLGRHGWRIAFSPLVTAHATAASVESSAAPYPPAAGSPIASGLARYGLSRPFRLP